MFFSCGGTRKEWPLGPGNHQQRPSLQSWALSSTFSPAFCMSLPAPATVLQPLSIPIENIPTRATINIRFIRLLLSELPSASAGPGVAATCVPRVKRNLAAVPCSRCEAGIRVFSDVARPSIPHQCGFSKQAFHQIHRQLGGAVLVIEQRVEFDNVQ